MRIQKFMWWNIMNSTKSQKVLVLRIVAQCGHKSTK